MRKILSVILGLCVALQAFPQSRTDMWDTEKLYKAPEAKELPAMEKQGVKAVVIDGIDYKGEKTSFFAYYGLPEGADADHPVPAMVLIHGGGGTAWWTWVKAWNERGYAAISMDTTGKIPVPMAGDPFDKGKANRCILPGGIFLEWGGFERGLRDPSEQWPFCAVSEIVLAHSFLNAVPGVDASRVGVTGNSWGGFLTLLTAAVDKRFRFAAPVYGCGYYNEFPGHAKRSGEAWENWLSLWDPSHYIPEIEVPVLWIGGTHDFYFDFGALQKSMALCKTPVYRSTRVEMRHADGNTIMPEETFVMADCYLKGMQALPVVAVPEKGKGRAVSVRFENNGREIVSAEMNYTTDAENIWKKRAWTTESVPFKKLRRSDGTFVIEAEIPDNAVSVFFNCITSDGLISSSSALML